MSHKIITIARQFGSGGHEVGERLSERLQIPLYDRSLVEMAAEKMGISPISLPLNDSTYLTQTAIIEALAKEGPCIIIGRCGDYILRNHPGLIDIFLCADMEDRITRIMERYELPRKDAASAIRHTDSRRRNY